MYGSLEGAVVWAIKGIVARVGFDQKSGGLLDYNIQRPCGSALSAELELELIQSHMAQKPVLRG